MRFWIISGGIIGFLILILSTSTNSTKDYTNDNYTTKPIALDNFNDFNKTIYIKYKGNVEINDDYEHFIKDSSLVKDSYYNTREKYFIIKLNRTYYHYCGFPQYLWNEFKNTDSLGKFYKRNIKGNYDCRYYKK